MVDPLRYQAPRFVQGRIGMVDSIQCRAGAEGFRVGVAALAKLPIGGNYRTFAAAGDGVGCADHMTPELQNACF